MVVTLSFTNSMQNGYNAGFILASWTCVSAVPGNEIISNDFGLVRSEKKVSRSDDPENNTLVNSNLCRQDGGFSDIFEPLPIPSSSLSASNNIVLPKHYRRKAFRRTQLAQHSTLKMHPDGKEFYFHASPAFRNEASTWNSNGACLARARYAG